MTASLKYEFAETKNKGRRARYRNRGNAVAANANTSIGRISTSRQEPPSLTVLDRNDQSVRRLPKPQPLPVWLRLMMGAQKGVALLTVPVILGVLAAYAQTVYLQHIWNQEYHTLEKLKRYERQLVAANEALKNQIAQQAERPASGMIPMTSANTIFVKPAPLDIKQPTVNAHPRPSVLPMGY